MGLALCRDATGKGPACPGLECCTKKERERDDGRTESVRPQEVWRGRETENGREEMREDNNEAGPSSSSTKYALL